MQTGIEEADCLPKHQAVLRAAEAQDVDAQIGGNPAQRRSERDRRIGDARAVDVDEQAAFVRERAQVANFVELVKAAELRCLRDRNGAGLRKMDVVSGTQIRLDVGRPQLTVAGRNRHHFRAAEAFESAAFVGLEMRAGRRKHRLPRTQHRAQRGNVCARAVERQEDFGLLAEVLFESGGRARGPIVLAVTDGVAAVRRFERFENFRRDRRVVVAGEAATHSLLHGF